MIPAPEPPSPSQEVPTENLLDVSVERLDELLMRPHQDHQEPSQPRVEELDPAVGGMEDLQGVLTAVRARLVSALECHLAQRSRLSCVATQTVRGFDDHLERTPLPSTGDEDECMQVDVEDDDREGAQEVVQRRSQETQVCLVKVQLQHDDEHNQRVALQRSQGTQADNGPQRDPIAHHLQCTLALERHALARLSRSLTGMAPGSLRRCPLKRLFRPRAAPGQGTRRGPRRGAESWTPRDCSPLKRLFRTRPAPGKGTRRRPRRGAESWTPRDCRRLRGWVRRHIWRTLEDLASPASTVPSTPTQHHVARIRRHCARAARSRAALQLQVAQLSAQLQEGEDERRCARGHIEFLQRRLQQLIHCSAVTARDLAALRSVHDKLTGELAGAKQLPGLCRDQDDDGLAAESKGSSDEGAKTASSRGGGDRKDSIDQGDDRKRLDEQLDHTPSKLVECEPPAPEERELAELDARVCQVVRGLRGCSSGCSGPGAECLMLLRVVPLLARQLLLERRRTASAASPRAAQHPLAPPNTPREALSTPSSPPRLQRALSRECAARLQAQSLAHQHHLHVVRAEHHKHVQSLNAAHLQTVGKLMDQHVVALSRAREQLRAEVRAEVQRELRRDMRAVVARSTADLEALHQAELNSLLRSSSDPGQRAPQWAPQCEGSGMPVSASETGLSDKNPHQLKKWLEIHEAEVVKQAASLALHSMDVGAAGDYVIAHATDSNAPPGGNISTPNLSSNRMSAWHSYMVN
ncbi:uncharacterized protein LOC127750321 isoform X2 [Frankliniella occidentalis]|uniref:Uncharacterized protein LOC127750321 isoform X2 n=1 Tax=Frankliniella occidentalis TaxID=133901 RepID=A0A9C6X243_FRAOC|nr:uncharacterized protein LOC127750321 isoform X2 [Frankliniella occidentalis]